MARRAQLAAIALAAAALLAAAASSEAAIDCAQLSSDMAPCFESACSLVAYPSAPCCSAFRSLASAARTPSDSRAACDCLKSAAARVTGTLYGATAARFPSRCGVKIRYTISPNNHC